MNINKTSVVVKPAVAEVREDRFTLELTQEELRYLFCAVGVALPNEVAGMAEEHEFEEQSLQSSRELSKVSSDVFYALKDATVGDETL